MSEDKKRDEGEGKRAKEERRSGTDRRRFLKQAAAAGAAAYAAPKVASAQVGEFYPEPHLIQFCADAGGVCLEPEERYCIHKVTKILSGDENGDHICDEDPRIYAGADADPPDAVICVTPCPFEGEVVCLPHTFRLVGTDCIFETEILLGKDICFGDCGFPIYQRIS